MYEFTIIVPVYNEEENLERVEKELLSYIEKALHLVATTSSTKMMRGGVTFTYTDKSLGVILKRYKNRSRL